MNELDLVLLGLVMAYLVIDKIVDVWERKQWYLKNPPNYTWFEDHPETGGKKKSDEEA